MNARNLMTSFSLIFLLCFFLNFVTVQVNANENNQTKEGNVIAPPVPSGNNSDTNVPKKNGAENNPPIEVESALQELKNYAHNIEKKTASNRNIIVSATVINMVLLALISGLMGYATKKEFKKEQIDTAEEVTPEVKKDSL
ncbi:sexual stage-specific protein precursor, putative [Plasmodium knowlesi strain H]|uniref:Sexual stage-specific protein, putative n=3 Tax=Plasmodium knowlesi TaxID=5850 RepID=A0A1A7VR13_PLAKH|nr:parasitophorous vacuole membrane protein S16, putative [Plasmodium knowlesi strain H]OTN68464.1 putative Sexual stage-specific protein [Plasmodium knowlesi]CAA9986471.1 parasitophorous vacuole membrane protein S16, putative [Plasmodium knowlesi strain H]SBO24275.1 sexual stage-specific protein precursor, putative [Plasmodium knowlesi strain H]SBO29719.1 sexual stage-specific protein precursor, putative [Plasmodium knowlesi strain H]VVS75945.1 parasitophorous vacuole membrane protein S16, pu